MKISNKGTYQDFLKGDIANKNFVFRLLKKTVNPSLVRSDGRPVYYVPSARIVAYNLINEKDPISNQLKTRAIRLIPGEPSIYVDQQSKDSDNPKKKYSIEFINGLKIVSGNDPLLLEWMMKCNWNESNPNRRTAVKPKFELVDAVKNIQKEMTNSKVEAEALAFAFSGNVEEVFAYARVLNVDTTQSELEVRFSLSLLAKRTKDNPTAPEKFMEGLKSASMRKKYNVLKAIDTGFLVMNSQTNSIALSSNPYNPIYTAPLGKDVVDGMVNLLSTDKGQQIYDGIIANNQDLQVPEAIEFNDKDVADSMAISKPKAPILADLPESDAELLDMLKFAEDKGIVTFGLPMWYTYRGDKFAKKEGFLNGLKSNLAMYKSFKYDLEKAAQVS
jgi:hypothetical protein